MRANASAETTPSTGNISVWQRLAENCSKVGPGAQVPQRNRQIVEKMAELRNRQSQ